MQTNSETAAFRRRLVRWFDKAARRLPWRGTRDPYAILVSEMMLQQTQVATVLYFYERWLKRFPDFATLAESKESEVLLAWQGLGYYSRARNLHRTAKVVMEEYGGIFPRDVERIRSLPGLGRYTAGAVATFAFDIPTPIVDANIARVLSRIFEINTPIDSTAGSKRVWEAAQSLQPGKRAGRFNAALMELGALVCIPRKPHCMICPVRGQCRAKDPASLPLKKARRETIHLTETVGFAREGERILLTQETGARWKGLWRLPALRTAKPGSPLLTRIKYPITHHQVTLEVVRAMKRDISGDALRWFSIGEITDVPMPSPHRRALNSVLAASVQESGMITQRMM